MTLTKWSLAAAGVLAAGLTVAGAGMLREAPHQDRPDADRGPDLPRAEAMPPPVTTPAGSSPAPAPPVDRPDEVGRSDPSEVTRSPEEIESRLRFALRSLGTSERLARDGRISSRELETSRQDLALLKSRTVDALDQLDDERERLQAEWQIRRAALRVAEADHQAVEADLALNQRLVKKVPGSVSPEEMAGAEAKVLAAAAQMELRQAEVAEVVVRLRQLERRRGHWLRVADEHLTFRDSDPANAELHERLDRHIWINEPDGLPLMEFLKRVMERVNQDAGDGERPAGQKRFHFLMYPEDLEKAKATLLTPIEAVAEGEPILHVLSRVLGAKNLTYYLKSGTLHVEARRARPGEGLDLP